MNLVMYEVDENTRNVNSSVFRRTTVQFTVRYVNVQITLLISSHGANARFVSTCKVFEEMHVYNNIIYVRIYKGIK